MNMRFRTKVSIVFLIAIIASMAFLSLATSLLLKPISIYDSKNQMEKYGEQISQSLSSQSQNLTTLMSDIYDSYLISTIIVDGSQTFDLDSNYGNLSDGTDTHEKMLTLIQEFEQQADNPYLVKRYDDSDQVKRLRYIRKEADGRYIIMTKSIKGIEQNIKLTAIFQLISWAVIALIGVLLWTILTRPFTNLIEKMSAVTQHISHLQFDKRVDYTGSDFELGQLSNSIDNLAVQLQKSITDLEDELQQRKTLIRNLSHEIKTPLTTIRGYTENTQIMAADNERVQRYCKIILSECDTLTLLSNEMMEVSSFDSKEELYKKEYAPIQPLFEKASERIEHEIFQSPVTVSFEPAVVCYNAYLLERVIFNFLGNADKYGTPNTYIHLSGKIIDQHYVLSVTNAGEAIPENERTLIWNDFYKVDKSRKRTNSYGIGLSIIKQIATMHNSQVGVLCENGQNTFYFSLPLSEQ